MDIWFAKLEKNNSTSWTTKNTLSMKKDLKQSGI